MRLSRVWPRRAGYRHGGRLHHGADLEFPLILAPAEETRTITLGVQQFIGQYVTDWNSVLASLTLAIVPILALYVIFSRQLIRGITAGAVK